MSPPRINPKYTSGLSNKDTKLQKMYIRRSQKESEKGIYKVRPTPKSYKHKPSRHVLDFERIYGVSTKSTKKISVLTGISASKQRRVLSKGRGAYFSSGSRAGQNPDSWGRARLASALLGRGACSVDQHILLPVTCKQLRDRAKSHTTN
jgi:hypothetical protein